MEETRTCPFCAETIKAAATLCRFCNRSLSASHPAPPAPQQSFKLTKDANAGGTVSGLIGFGLLVWWGWTYYSGAPLLGPLDASSAVPASPVAALAASVAAPSLQRFTLVPRNVRSVTGTLGIPALTGTISNTTGSRLGYAEVKANFFDKNGNVVATGMDNELSVEAGQTWHFEVGWPQDARAKTGTIVEATGTP